MTKALEIRKKQLGLYHPDTIGSLRNVVLCMMDRKQFPAAQRLIRSYLADMDQQRQAQPQVNALLQEINRESRKAGFRPTTGKRPNKRKKAKTKKRPAKKKRRKKKRK